ncbi:unnamed protein product [Closterium sp. Yama58-4]|nr:unnamed protein product [Closterium sp. Yama58-4]
MALFAGDSSRREMVLTGKESRRYEQDIKRIAAQFRLHSRLYNKSLVLSKDPLPHYRPELDSRRPQRQSGGGCKGRRVKCSIGLPPSHLTCGADYFRVASPPSLHSSLQLILIVRLFSSSSPPHSPVQLSFPPEVLEAIDKVVADVRAKREREERLREERESEEREREAKEREESKAAFAAGSVGGEKRGLSGRGLTGLQGEKGEEEGGGRRRRMGGEEEEGQEEEAGAVRGGAREEVEEVEERKRWQLWRISESLKRRQQQWQASPEGASMLTLRQSLPAWKERERLLQAVRNNQVVVVSGETGCGKTTQLPQYLLEDAVESGEGAQSSIICTQPRRISAVAVAERVAAERGESIGQSVGYQVRLEARRSRATHLLFCTTGVLLRRLASDPLLTGVTHIVVDEIHERGMNEDFLLIVLRDLLPRRPDLKLVLMSATLNADLFSQYFSGAPTLHIPGFTYPVRSYFLEDVLELTGHEVTLYNQVTLSSIPLPSPNKP